jgi:hypothetical protein
MQPLAMQRIKIEVNPELHLPKAEVSVIVEVDTASEGLD